MRASRARFSLKRYPYMRYQRTAAAAAAMPSQRRNASETMYMNLREFRSVPTSPMSTLTESRPSLCLSLSLAPHFERFGSVYFFSRYPNVPQTLKATHNN